MDDKKLKVDLDDHLLLELEVQAEAEGLSPEEHAAELIKESLSNLPDPGEPSQTKH